MATETKSVQSCYATWSESYFEEYYGENAPYPPVHVKLIVDALKAHGAKSVLDAGCGPASILRTLAKLKFDCFGFDLTPGMVSQAQHALAEFGVPADRVWQGDASAAKAYASRVPFDAAIAIGVLPHLSPDGVEATMRNLFGAVRSGGIVIVQARNALFSLFTMNRNTHAFVRDELIGVDEAADADEQAFLEQGAAEFAECVRMDLPENRGGAGYDDTQPRAENPLMLPRKFEACGFEQVEALFYHYHAVPPMCEASDRAMFRRLSMAKEQRLGPKDWRGHFMASSFMLVGRKP